MRLSSQFQRLWLGQWLSNLGSQISFYGLGLWLFTRADQFGPYAAVALVVQFGRLMALPVLSRRLHHWPRRRVMGAAYVLGGGVTAAVAVSLWRYGSALPFPLLLVLLAAGAMAESTLVLSFSTLIPQLVREDQLGLANGLFATTDGLVYLVAPYLGALCVARLGMAGVLSLDLLSFGVAFLCLGLGSWPRSAASPLRLDKGASSGLMAASLSLLQQSRLGGLLLLGTVLMAGFAAAELLFPAWVLAALGVDRLTAALVVSGGGYGLGLLLWQWLWAQRPGQWPRVFVAGLLVQGLVLTGALFQSAQATVWLWFFGVAVFNCSVPPVLAAQQSLWHRWIPQDRQPALFAARYAWDWTARLLTVALGGLLVDRWLAPVLAQLDWSLLGSGPGRALAVGLGIVGLVQLLVFLALAPGFSSRNEKLT
ncbi:hypothetical protein [Synechococcus sp. W4D4]|uniref:hypothetical protein n=1 Tax=Synechococcus sp. W4D4 TaxID=3392294 RepID=UPI0039E807F9